MGTLAMRAYVRKTLVKAREADRLVRERNRYDWENIVFVLCGEQ
jgi:hypothetical protein